MKQISSLRGIKVLVSLAMLVAIFRDDIRTIDQLPVQLFSPPPLFRPFLEFIPVKWILSGVFLNVLHWLLFLGAILLMVDRCKGFLLAGLLLLYFIYGNILRSFAPNNFHNDICAFYVLTIIAASEIFVFVNKPMNEHQTVFLIRLALTLTYFLCGLNKVIHGGAEWISSTNLKHILYADSLNTNDFNWSISINASIPNIFYLFASIIVVIAQLSAPLALVIAGYRKAFVVIMLLFHASVFIFQQILFLDVPILLFSFLNWNQSDSKIFLKGKLFSLTTLTVIVIGLLVFIFRVESFPLSAWSIYSKSNENDEVTYSKLYLIDESGNRWESNLNQIHPFFREQRYQKLLLPRNRLSLVSFIKSYNTASNTPIKALAFEQWKWNCNEGYSSRQLPGKLMSREIISIY